MADIKDVCKHAGYCSVYSCDYKTSKMCKICDCGALKRAILKAVLSPEYDDLWKAWDEHIDAIRKSYGEEDV